MTRIASERAGLRAVKTARVSEPRSRRVRFYAVEDSFCVEIEADSEEDAKFLCRDMKLQFIGFVAGGAGG